MSRPSAAADAEGMRPLLVLAATLSAALAAVGAATAITNGQPDAGRHPYVGLVAFYDDADVYVQRCTGSLIARRVVLTAAHCAFADDGRRLTTVRVWFDDVVGPGVISGCGGTPGGSAGCGIRGVATPHPGFDGFETFPDTKDLAVVRLDARARGIPLAKLPPVGVLDALRKTDPVLTLVGYGFVRIKPTVDDGGRTRRQTTARLAGLNGAQTDGVNVRTKPGPEGGTFCDGDSGGPVLLDTSRTIVAVSSLVKGSCGKADLSYRVDTQASQDWIRAASGADARIGDDSEG